MRSSGEALKACRDLLKSKLEFSMAVGRGKRWQNRCVGASWPPGFGQGCLGIALHLSVLFEEMLLFSGAALRVSAYRCFCCSTVPISHVKKEGVSERRA